MDAYKIGVSLALTNNVSGALAVIARASQRRSLSCLPDGAATGVVAPSGS